jgi:CheY-like chemotaxis protein
LSQKIIVCDDHSHVRRVLQLKLEQSGFEVLTATNGREALDLVRDANPQALITDLSMPEMGGRELCLRLQAEGRLPALRVLVVTSSADRSARAWVEALPGVSLLEKPLSPKQVRDWVVEQLAASAGVPK